MDLLAELWARASAVATAPDVRQSGIAGLVALAVLVVAWRPARMLLTVCHEVGHALVALLTGRRVQGIRLHSDTSGLTRSRGAGRGIGMALTLSAGYPSPAVAGLASAAAIERGHAVGLLWAMVALSVVLLLVIRNWFGVLTIVAIGGGLAAASWYAPPVVLGWVACGLAWLLLLGAPRVVIEAFREPANGASDAAQLAALSHVPRMLWKGLWFAGTLACLAVGASWLLPGILTRVG
jgi:hypothetical protein